MDRKAALILASRALALIQGICALIEISYIPERLFSYLHYAHMVGQAGAPTNAAYLSTSYQLEAGFLLFRILIYLTLAVVFWNCAPWVQRIMLPESEP